ncbi:MAG: glycosyltransferase [Bacillota bacterium]
MKKILIASPVKQKPQILKEFLWSLDRLEKKGLIVEYSFIDDNEEGSALLREFASGRDNVTIISGGSLDSYRCDETTHHWREDLIWKVAMYKDRFIRKAGEGGFDFLFLVDSDLVLNPQTLVHLAGLGKDIVSEVYWTRWEPEMIPLPQVWMGDQYRLHHKKRGEVPDDAEIGLRQAEFLEMLKRPGTYRVGGLGACTLISRRAISMGVSFSEIYNLDLIGEDRHFCIRAAALGLDLYADTHYPPYHIYRESELEGLKEYKARNFPEEHGPGAKRAKKNAPPRQRKPRKGSRITLAMLVRNESGRYLEAVLGQAAHYITGAVILDDASTDGTPEICKKILRGIPLELISNRVPLFHNEILLRKQLWELAVSTSPDWILILDADEVFEDRAVKELPLLAADPGAQACAFRLYDMWTHGHYREDAHWSAHLHHRVFMVRNIPGFPCRWRETPQHCGRFPVNVNDLRVVQSHLRIKHLGWMRPADRLSKYFRYRELDPGARYGVASQYLSILDPKPNLVPWEEYKPREP